MSDLASKKCIPCEGNIPPFNTEEIHKYLKQVDGWEVIEDKIDGFHLIKNFKFNPKQPMSRNSWKIWNEYGNEDFPENYCHKTGKKSNGKTSMRKPIL